MGRQIRFLMTPEDVLNAEQRIKSKLECTIMAARSPSRRPLVLPNLSVVEQVGGGTDHLYLARPSEVSLIRAKQVSSTGDNRYWRIDQSASAVVELSQRPFDGNVLYQGRLYYETSYLDEDGEWAQWRPEFVTWAAALVRLFKKGMKRLTFVYGSSQYREYIGDAAERWRNATQARRTAYRGNPGLYSAEVLASLAGRVVLADREFIETDRSPRRESQVTVS